MNSENKFFIIILLAFFSCGVNNNRTEINLSKNKSMKKIVGELFEKIVATKYNDSVTEKKTQSIWIGNPPATKVEINEAETRLGIKLPNEYKEFLQIANGYPTYNDTVEPSFAKVNEIQYLKDIYPEIITIWKETGNEQISSELNRSIIIGGINEEQWFLIIPPKDQSDKWKYWMFANWIPGEIEYHNLQEYFLHVIESIE
jgi:cell wall assembly regulator SMI1